MGSPRSSGGCAAGVAGSTAPWVAWRARKLGERCVDAGGGWRLLVRTLLIQPRRRPESGSNPFLAELAHVAAWAGPFPAMATVKGWIRRQEGRGTILASRQVAHRGARPCTAWQDGAVAAECGRPGGGPRTWGPSKGREGVAFPPVSLPVMAASFGRGWCRDHGCWGGGPGGGRRGLMGGAHGSGVS